jgi:hypothetical protein
MKTCVASGEPANAFFIAELELGFEQGNCPFADWAEAKLFSRRGEETGLFKHG